MSTALSVSNVLDVALKTAQDGLGKSVNRFAPFTSFFYDNAEALRLNWEDAMPAPAVWDGTSDIPLNTLGVSHTQTLTAIRYALGVQVFKNEIQRRGMEVAVGGRVAAGFERLGRAIQKLVFLALQSGNSQLVPDGAGSTTQAIGSGHLLGDGSTTQANILTDLLSHASLEAVQAMRSNWMDSEGEALLLDPEDCVIVADVSQRSNVHAMLKSQGMTIATVPVGGGEAVVMQDATNLHAEQRLLAVLYPFSLLAGGNVNNWWFMPRGMVDPPNAARSPFVVWMPEQGIDIGVNGIVEPNDDKSIHILFDIKLAVAWTAPAFEVGFGSYPGAEA
ncbi:MAG: hypothetical protein AMXMBFR77_28030 [Phycisphaerales bacterium]